MKEKAAAAGDIVGMATAGQRGLYIQAELSQLNNKAIWTGMKGKRSPENLNLLSTASRSFNHRGFEG